MAFCMKCGKPTEGKALLCEDCLGKYGYLLEEEPAEEPPAELPEEELPEEMPAEESPEERLRRRRYEQDEESPEERLRRRRYEQDEEPEEERTARRRYGRGAEREDNYRRDRYEDDEDAGEPYYDEDDDPEESSGALRIFLLVFGILLAAVLIAALVIGISHLKTDVKETTRPAATQPVSTEAPTEMESQTTTAAETSNRPTLVPETTSPYTPEVNEIVKELAERLASHRSHVNAGTVEYGFVDDITLVYDSDSLAEADVPAGGGSAWNREYYYRWGELYYVSLTNAETGVGEELFFRDGELVRWRDGSGAKHDKETDNSEFNARYQYQDEAESLYNRFWDKKSAIPETSTAESSSESSSAAETTKADGTTKAAETTKKDAAGSTYILPKSDSKYLKKKDIKGLTKEQLRLARNELYARHGRRFEDPDLQAYFDAQSWYHGTIDPDDYDAMDEPFNKYELANRDFLMEAYENAD